MQRPGRVSLGLVAALTTLGAVVVILLAGGGTMFSPGGLNAQGRGDVTRGGVRSHAEIGNCAACHVSPWSGDTMASRCLACHSDVRDQIDTHQPMHGMLSDGMECRTCHTEHQGAHGVLTSFAKFDHGCTAFQLTGMHRALDCKSCHADSTYKGTPQTCASCHAEPQVHKERFGTNCALCHATTTWRTPTLKVGTPELTNFNHDLTGFKLTGKHSALDCKACHVNNAFKGTPPTCVSCHAEPPVHKGRFGNNCVQCHSTSTWAGATFKHTFPLNHGVRGKQKSSCTTCHKTPNDYKAYTCYGCHRHDPVKTEKRHARVAAADLPKCARCHPNGREHRRGKEGSRTELGADGVEACPVCLDAGSDWPLPASCARDDCFARDPTGPRVWEKDVANRLEQILLSGKEKLAHLPVLERTLLQPPRDLSLLLRPLPEIFFDRERRVSSK